MTDKIEVRQRPVPGITRTTTRNPRESFPGTIFIVLRCISGQIEVSGPAAIAPSMRTKLSASRKRLRHQIFLSQGSMTRQLFPMAYPRLLPEDPGSLHPDNSGLGFGLKIIQPGYSDRV